MDKTLKELLAQSWEIYTGKFKYFFIAAAVLIFPISLVADFLTPPDAYTGDTLEALWQNLVTDPMLLWSTLGVNVVGYVVGVMLMILVVRGTAKAFKNMEPDLREEMGAGLNDLIPVFLTHVVAAFITAALAMLLFIPGLIFFVFIIFLNPVIVLEGKRFFQALQGSIDLVRGRWWNVFGKFLGLWVIVGFIAILVGLATGPLLAYPILGATIATITEIIMLFVTVFITVFYLELKKGSASPSSEPTDTPTKKPELKG